MAKKYVEVGAVFRPDGSIIPVLLWWDDGRSYQIDRVLDVRRAASLKAGGVGRRYTCRICGQERYLFLEDNGKWFVETKEEQLCADGLP